jgi:hypothetical protein
MVNASMVKMLTRQQVVWVTYLGSVALRAVAGSGAVSA